MATKPEGTGKDKQPKKATKERRARGEGAIFFSESKQAYIWRAVVGHKPDGGVKYKEGRAKTEAEALRRKKAAEKAGSQPHEDKETVGNHLDDWLSNRKANVRHATWVSYEVAVRLHLKPKVGGCPLKQLTVAQVSRLYADLSRCGMKAGNLRKVATIFASALEVAVAEGKISVAPTRNAVKPRVLDTEIEVFADEEVQAILAAASSVRFGALFVLAIATGARRGELLALEATDFDLAAGTVRIVKTLNYQNNKFVLNPPKSRTGTRVISLPEFAIEAMRTYLEGRGPGPLWTTSTGTYFSPRNLIKFLWSRVLRKAGLKYRKFHTTRHTHASRLLAAGVDAAEVAKRLGDKIATVLKTYAHWIPAVNRDTAAKLESIYGSKPKAQAS